MARTIGKGVSALLDFVKKCETAGGIPQIRTGYGGVEFNDKVIVACYGKASEVPGGEIYGIPKELIDKCRQTTGDYKFIEQWASQLTY